MNDEYFLINKKVLPKYFEKVIEIKSLINNGYSVIDACKKVDLSRSTFYKYKDYVSLYTTDLNNYIFLDMKLNGLKSCIVLLNIFNDNDITILRMHQDIKINDITYLNLITLNKDKTKIENIIKENKLVLEYKMTNL